MTQVNNDTTIIGRLVHDIEETYAKDSEGADIITIKVSVVLELCFV